MTRMVTDMRSPLSSTVIMVCSSVVADVDEQDDGYGEYRD